MGSMGKTAESGARGASAGRRVGRGEGERETSPRELQPEPRIDAGERLTRELARLRAKFGADPAIASKSLDDAWTSPTAAMEEDEAEFIDAVADCLGVGLSLDAALTCWDSGGLVYDDAGDEDGDEGDPSLPAVVAHHGHVTGRRLVVQ